MMRRGLVVLLSAACFACWGQEGSLPGDPVIIERRDHRCITIPIATQRYQADCVLFPNPEPVEPVNPGGSASVANNTNSDCYTVICRLIIYWSTAAECIPNPGTTCRMIEGWILVREYPGSCKPRKDVPVFWGQKVELSSYVVVLTAQSCSITSMSV